MSKTIYDSLIAGGLSPVGACAVMGNMYCESTLKANIVEKRCPMTDEQYTALVDSDPSYDFENDYDPVSKENKHYGYGLCQWTYHTRKRELLALAREKGVSVGDEALQCAFCIIELKRDYPNLYKELCSLGDLYTLTAEVCKQYERPAVNNINPRYGAACKYFEQYCTVGGAQAQAIKPDIPATPSQPQPSFLDGILSLFGLKKETSTICDQRTWIALAKRMPNINYGCNSDAVKALQCMLNVCGAKLHADGDWKDKTEAAFKEYKGGAL